MNPLLAGAPPAGQTSIINPVLSESLLDILLNQGPVAFFSIFIPKLIGLAFVIGSLVFFFILIIGAIQWIISGGDKAAIEQARGKILNAIIGLVILFSIYVIIKIIESFFGLSILTLDIQSLIIQ